MKSKTKKSSKKQRVKYLEPKMRFNVGMMGYEPVLPKNKKASQKKLSRVERVSAWIWIASIISMIIMMILFIILVSKSY